MKSHQKYCVINRHAMCQMKVVMKQLGELYSLGGGIYQVNCCDAETVLECGTFRIRNGKFACSRVG